MALTLASNAITFTDSTSLSSGIITSAQLSAGAVQQSFGNTSGAFSFRNKIINGEFKVWQRGTSQASTGYGSADRWKLDVCTNFNFLQQTNNPGGCAFFATNATNDIIIAQTLEDSQISSLRGKNVTLSFGTNNSGVVSNLQVSIQKSLSANNSAATDWVNIGSTTLTVDNTTAPRTLTAFVPNDGTVAGLRVAFRATNITNGAGIGLYTVQLEEGSVATPFEQRPIGLELSLCQRYYTDAGAGWSGVEETATTFSMAFSFPVPMRAAPVLTLLQSNVDTRIVGLDRGISGCTINSQSTSARAAWVLLNCSGGNVASRFIQGRLGGSVFGANAEL